MESNSNWATFKLSRQRTGPWIMWPLFLIHMHKRVLFDFFHESKFPIYRWFRDKIGYSSLFKDIPPIIPAYQYSDRMILMELFQDSDPITRSFMRCTLKVIIKRLFEVSGLLSDNYKNDVFIKMNFYTQVAVHFWSKITNSIE